jgi:hypothetical protein
LLSPPTSPPTTNRRNPHTRQRGTDKQGSPPRFCRSDMVDSVRFVRFPRRRDGTGQQCKATDSPLRVMTSAFWAGGQYPVKRPDLVRRRGTNWRFRRNLAGARRTFQKSGAFSCRHLVRLAPAVASGLQKRRWWLLPPLLLIARLTSTNRRPPHQAIYHQQASTQARL